MSRFILWAMLVATFSARPSAALAQRTVATIRFGDVTPPPIDTTKALQDRRISDGSRVGAIIVSSMIGLGIGHSVMGFNRVGRTFLITQGAGAVLAVLAFGLGASGEPVFWGGTTLYLGSRVWEFVDVVVRPAAHNARIDAAEDASRTQSRLEARLSPVFDRGRQGLALSVRF